VKDRFPALLFGVGLSTAVITPAAAYPVDCAILLCLAGGWPASAECAHARAVFIRRITPWPIEPPLQIWNCPMRAGLRDAGTLLEKTRLLEISAPQSVGLATPLNAVLVNDGPNASSWLSLIAEEDYSGANGSADIDISGREYDFVRSIRVFSVEHARQWWGGMDGECKQQQVVRLGTYGAQGEFVWRAATVAELPESFRGLERWGAGSCPQVKARAVYIEWWDIVGQLDFEQVDY
jgi:hypothetical protein